MMLKIHIHELNRKIQAAGGWYEIQEEKRITLREKDFLCLLGQGVLDSSCCGVWGCFYAVVPGMIVDWKFTTDKEGRELTRVETVRDPILRQEIQEIILEKERVDQIRFW